MTRETRIGLLVGLLFIIMFGIVLAGLTNTNAPPPTPVASTTAVSTNSDVREILYVPTMDSDRRPVAAATPTSGPSADADAASNNAAVSVAMHNEDAASGVSSTMSPPSGPAELHATVTPPGEEVAVATHTPGGITTETLDHLNKALSNDDTAVVSRDGATADVAAAPGSALPAGTKLYEVKQGDTLFRIARQQYGPANTGKHTLILEANKDKIKGPAGLKIGMKLVIPPLPDAAPAATPSVPTTRPSTPASRRPPSRSGLASADPLPAGLLSSVHDVAPAAGTKSYTVKAGDNLYKIARASGTTIDKILKANKVKNPRDLKVGTKLEIPS